MVDREVIQHKISFIDINKNENIIKIIRHVGKTKDGRRIIDQWYRSR
ncbi:MAG: hypothetical protein PWQ96_2361 [Clostridia bacterium]|jgi:hypothetical protein|nr:hypothetical protein [Clostridia bacterium]